MKKIVSDFPVSWYIIDDTFRLRGGFLLAETMILPGRNKKKNLLVFFLALLIVGSAVFVFDAQSAHAGLFDLAKGAYTAGWEAAGGSAEGSAAVNKFKIPSVTDMFSTALKLLLLGIFTVLGWLASVAVTLFEWVIKPENISGSQGLLDQAAIYEMWKFIRDFFNLFFILTLLYIAFTIVFQVAKDYKKSLLSLVLVALLVNFSFPVSRFLIDATNVPMYFFANQMMASNGKSPGEGGGVFSSAMSASQIKGILIPGAENGGSVNADSISFERYFVAIIFMFLFSVTLLVLAVMFVIRLVALVILVIFSSVGIAASIIPGMEKYANQWWDNFWKYALFGPAAMLMLLVATRFFSALGDMKTGVFKSLRDTASGTVSADPTFFASMAMFSIPIIMLWMAMSLAQTMSLAGASSVVGVGKKFSSWAGKKFSGYNAVKRNYDSFAGARKKRDEEKNKNNLGVRLGKGLNKKQDQVLAAMGSKAAGARVKDIYNKAVYEQAEENKKNGVSDSELKTQLHGGDKVKAASAAISLSERKAIKTTEDFSKAIEVLGNNTKEISALINNADSEALGMEADEYGKIVNSSTFKDEDGNPKNIELKKQLDAKIKKEGQIKVKIDYEISTSNGTDEAKEAIYKKNLDMSPEDLAKQGSVLSAIGTDVAFTEYLKEQAKNDLDYYQKTIDKSKKSDREKLKSILPTGDSGGKNSGEQSGTPAASSSQGGASNISDKLKQKRKENRR